jgi:hypothetical protein
VEVLLSNLSPGELYEDNQFKCDLSSLGLRVFKELLAEDNLKHVTWVRPKVRH